MIRMGDVGEKPRKVEVVPATPAVRPAPAPTPSPVKEPVKEPVGV